MNENVSYESEKTDINEEKMQVTVINKRPQYLKKSQREVRREIETQLFRIFEKYM